MVKPRRPIPDEPETTSIDLKTILGKLETAHEELKEAADLEGQRLRQVLLLNEELSRNMIDAEMEFDRASARQKELLREVADLEKRAEEGQRSVDELVAARDTLRERADRETAALAELRKSAETSRKALDAFEQEIGPLRQENETLKERVGEAEETLRKLRAFRDDHRRKLAKHLSDIDTNTERSLSEGNA